MQNSTKWAANEGPDRRSRFEVSIRHRLRHGAITAGIFASIWLLSGCLHPGSKGYDDSKHVWTSPRSLPQTVQLVDTRDDTVLWEMEVPAGKWLVTKLIEGKATGDNPDRPDRLKFRITRANAPFTTLTSSIDVPAAEFRRWELTLREPASALATASAPTLIPRIELPKLEWDAVEEPVVESIDLDEEAEEDSGGG